MAEIITVPAGALTTNCYLIGDPSARVCAVVDAGGEATRIITAIESIGWNVEYVFATHGHADHTGAVAQIVAKTGAKFAAGRADEPMISDPPEWLTSILMDFEQPPALDVLLDGGETIGIGDFSIYVLATPGHTPGSMCFRVEDSVLTGDTLFKGSIGRYDLPGGDGVLERQSIRQVLMSLDNAIRVLPGHGPPSTIGEERMTNPFIG